MRPDTKSNVTTPAEVARGFVPLETTLQAGIAVGALVAVAATVGAVVGIVVGASVAVGALAVTVGVCPVAVGVDAHAASNKPNMQILVINNRNREIGVTSIDVLS
jgi:hypothetical protein